jgi:hypothetical protein
MRAFNRRTQRQIFEQKITEITKRGGFYPNLASNRSLVKRNRRTLKSLSVPETDCILFVISAIFCSKICLCVLLWLSCEALQIFQP